MNIGNFIYSMYTNLPDFIEMSFILNHEGEFIAKGIANVHSRSETITLNGDLKDTNTNKFKDKNTSIMFINTNDLPLYFSCELKDFPVKNRIDEMIDKDIIISFPKVKLSSNFSLNMFQDYTKFECDMTPLYVMNESEPLLCNLYLNEM